MDAETVDACTYGGKLISVRIVEALKDKDPGTMYETYARKGNGTEKEDLLDLLKQTVVLPSGYAIKKIRVVGDGWHAIITGVKL